MNQNIFKIQDGVRYFDFKECLAFIYNQGQIKYGKNFKIKKEDLEIYYKLLIYAIRDEENCKKYNIELNKGILLLGPVGCGKTSLMTLIRPFFEPEYQYRIKAAREVSFEFINDGFAVLNKYGKAKVSYCFDDLGVEKSLKHFGNDCNTLAEILLSNYDYFFETKNVTHATTNLNAEELENLYGNRVRSRLREMFNLISFDRNVEDKRM
jgi:energy-coupling factor transporter ATP-binding protein EcfA2